MVTRFVAISAFMMGVSAPGCSTDPHNPMLCPVGFYCHDPSLQLNTPSKVRLWGPQYCVPCETKANSVYYQRKADNSKVEVPLEKLCNAQYANSSAISKTYGGEFSDQVLKELEAACDDCMGGDNRYLSIREIIMNRVNRSRRDDWAMILMCIIYTTLKVGITSDFDLNPF